MSLSHSETLSELRREDVAPAQSLGDHGRTIVAWSSLALIDLVLKASGFKRFHRLVRRFPTRQVKAPDARRASRLCAAVDRAALYYFKKAWCLQRSAAAVCLLRLAGIPAELVIGVKRMPFYAHAWVEWEGQVVNDHPVVQKRYFELERC